MIRRVLNQRIFLGSTIEEVNSKVNEFLRERDICVGNYVDCKLSKLGGVYQYILIFAEVINETVQDNNVCDVTAAN